MSSSYDSTASTILNNGMHWWNSSKQDAHKDIFAYIGYLDQNQSYRSADNLRFARLYGNYEMAGLDSYSYNRVETSYNVTHRVTMNIVQSMIDTVVSKIGKNKPKPTFLTSGGDFTLQLKAKKLSKFVEGVFYGSEFYKHARMAFQDSCIFGTGCVKIMEVDGEIKAERVFIDEIKLDDTESFYGAPRQMHQVKYVHRDVLVGMFPDKKVQIEAATDAEAVYSTNRGTRDKQMVMVVESWHLPSSKAKKHDGKHIISTANCTLFEEEWNKDYFPFVFFRWNERPVGFFGQGMSEQLQGLQLEINKILRTIQVSMHLTSIPKVFVEASSKIVTAHLNNKIGGIIKYAGTKPSYESVSAIPQDLFMHLDRLYNRAYEIAGVSQLAAQSKKPSGLDSGKALREFNDIESERFMSVGQRYEEAFINAADIIIDLARDIYSDNPDFAVKAKGSKFIETIKWADVDMEDDKYMMQIFPTSALASTPAGRLQDVQELLQAGFISKEQGLKLLDFPDLEGAYNMVNAAYDDIEAMIERMVSKGEYQTPEPYQNLELGIQMCQQAYLHYRSVSAPDDKLELLRMWMEDAQALMKKAQEALQPPPLPPEALAAQQAPVDPALLQQGVAEQAPIGVPEAPPTTDLLPVT